MMMWKTVEHGALDYGQQTLYFELYFVNNIIYSTKQYFARPLEAPWRWDLLCVHYTAAKSVSVNS